MEGIGSCNNLGFYSCQIQENTGCARIGSWGRVGDITGIYSVCFEVGCIFVSNLSQLKTIRFSFTDYIIICYNKTRLAVAACLDFSGIPQ